MNIRFILLSILLISLTLACNDVDFESDLEKEGLLQVAVSENIVDGKFVYSDYEVYFRDSKDQGVYSLDVDENDLAQYIGLSGKNVALQANQQKKKLQPKSIREISSPDFKTQKKGGNGGGKPGGGGGGGGGDDINHFLVVLMSDAVSTPPCSPEDMQEIMIGAENELSIANYYNTVSKGVFTIDAVTVAEVFIDEIPCYMANLSANIDPLLLSDGYNVDDYDHIIYVSTGNNCPYGGRADLNGKRSHTEYCSFPSISTHELGHNLGLGHSSRGSSEYGDASCVMGVQYRELNAPHRVNLDWIESGKLKLVRKSGVFNLEPLELSNTSEYQVLQIKTSRNSSFYLSYRAAIGPFDSGLQAEFVDQLSIHSWLSETGVATNIVETLAVGETYSNASLGLDISVLSLDNGVMTVQVNK